jgi:hypothetical protein
MSPEAGDAPLQGNEEWLLPALRDCVEPLKELEG